MFGKPSERVAMYGSTGVVRVAGLALIGESLADPLMGAACCGLGDSRASLNHSGAEINHRYFAAVSRTCVGRKLRGDGESAS